MINEHLAMQIFSVTRKKKIRRIILHSIIFLNEFRFYFKKKEEEEEKSRDKDIIYYSFRSAGLSISLINGSATSREDLI